MSDEKGLEVKLSILDYFDKHRRDCVSDVECFAEWYSDQVDKNRIVITALEADKARLDWLMRNVSGMEFRRLGIVYSGNCGRADIDAAMKEDAK